MRNFVLALGAVLFLSGCPSNHRSNKTFELQPFDVNSLKIGMDVTEVEQQLGEQICAKEKKYYEKPIIILYYCTNDILKKNLCPELVRALSSSDISNNPLGAAFLLGATCEPNAVTKLRGSLETKQSGNISDFIREMKRTTLENSIPIIFENEKLIGYGEEFLNSLPSE